MAYLLLGLIIFLGLHSVRIVADDWRARTRARIGESLWKGLYSAASLVGFGLVLWGFGLAREHPTQIWSPPVALRHMAFLLTLMSFVLLSASYLPGNAVKIMVHHPMVLAVQSWALAHLLINGNSAHIVLFGSLLVWSIINFTSSVRRDRAAGTSYSKGRAWPTALTILAGLFGWVLFAFWLHGLLIGVRPLG